MSHRCDSVTRRRFTSSTAMAMGGLAGFGLAACSGGTDPESCEAVAAQIWRADGWSGVDTAGLTGESGTGRELVRCATLAPSSHNTQCWKFALADKASTILPDLSRRCPAVDPDDHHLFVSLGCAAENPVQAARAHGLHAEPRFDTARDAIHVPLAATHAAASPLFEAIAERQCTRGDCDGRPLSVEKLRLLERAGTSGGVRLLLLTERPAMERVLEHVVQGNTAQMADPAFIEELKSWIRFNGADAVRTRDGLFSVASGNPAVPALVGELAFGWLFTARSENEKYVRQVRSSAGMPSSRALRPTSQAGSRSAAATSVSRCGPRHSASGAPSSNSRWKCLLSAHRSPMPRARPGSAPTWWCGSVAGRPCRARCVVRFRL